MNMSNEQHISDFLKNTTQEQLAGALGITQGAVNQMLKSGRDIRIVLSEEGLSAYEIRSVPAK